MPSKKIKVGRRKIQPDYVIKPAAGSLLGDVFVSQQDPEKLGAALTRMLENSGVKQKKDKKNV